MWSHCGSFFGNVWRFHNANVYKCVYYFPSKKFCVFELVLFFGSQLFKSFENLLAVLTIQLCDRANFYRKPIATVSHGPSHSILVKIRIPEIKKGLRFKRRKTNLQIELHLLNSRNTIAAHTSIRSPGETSFCPFSR